MCIVCVCFAQWPNSFLEMLQYASKGMNVGPMKRKLTIKCVIVSMYKHLEVITPLLLQGKARRVCILHAVLKLN